MAAPGFPDFQHFSMRLHKNPGFSCGYQSGQADSSGNLVILSAAKHPRFDAKPVFLSF
jgi:hypothetical protein